MKELKSGRYTIVRTLGSGAQGDTFEAREGDRRVAIKALRVAHAKAWKDVELAEREARTLSTLDHDRIPRYFDHFEEDGVLYLVMELVDGESLAAMRKAGHTFGVTDVTRMLDDADHALSYLHSRTPPVIHRDLKPGNVLYEPMTKSHRFVDFGCVRDRLRADGGSTVVGTFGYMAPEQFQGRASPASDVYGIGATALAMLTGKEPEDLPHKGLAIDVRAAVPKNVPEPLVNALCAMLDPDPDARAQSIAEALRLGAKRVPVTAKPQDDPPPKRDRKRRRQERRARRKARRGGARLPFLPRAVVQLLLLVVRLVVWLVVSLVVPLVLLILSIVFGRALRRAAEACWRAGGRASAGIGFAQAWLAGEEPEKEETSPVVRVASDAEPRVRVAQSRIRDDEALAETEIGHVADEKRRRAAR
jgi:serine/threonine protein kinase